METLRINDAWREILSGKNQLTLVKLLRKNLLDILGKAESLDFISLDSDKVEEIDNFSELGHMPKAYNMSYWQEDSEFFLNRSQQFSHAVRKGELRERMSKEDARRYDNLLDISRNTAYMLRYFRNRNSHELDEIDDPGHATALAGVVLQLIECSLPPKDMQQDINTLNETVENVLEICVSHQQTQKDEDKPDEQGPLIPEKKETEEANIVVEKIEEFRSELKNNIKMLADRIPDEEQLSSVVSAIAEQVIKKMENPNYSVADTQEKPPDWGIPDEEEYEGVEAAGVLPSLTPRQAENRLIALRNRIGNENPDIKPWHNVLQLKFIEQIIEERISDHEQFKKSDGHIGRWYKDTRNDPDIINAQLKKYGEKIFEIVKSIATDIPF